MLTFFVLTKLANKLDGGINHISFNSNYHNTFKFTLKLIKLLTISIFFIRNLQTCVLRENSNDLLLIHIITGKYYKYQ